MDKITGTTAVRVIVEYDNGSRTIFENPTDWQTQQVLGEQVMTGYDPGTGKGIYLHVTSPMAHLVQAYFSCKESDVRHEPPQNQVNP